MKNAHFPGRESNRKSGGELSGGVRCRGLKQEPAVVLAGSVILHKAYIPNFMSHLFLHIFLHKQHLNVCPFNRHRPQRIRRPGTVPADGSTDGSAAGCAGLGTASGEQNRAFLFPKAANLDFGERLGMFSFPEYRPRPSANWKVCVFSGIVHTFPHKRGLHPKNSREVCVFGGNMHTFPAGTQVEKAAASFQAEFAAAV